MTVAVPALAHEYTGFEESSPAQTYSAGYASAGPCNPLGPFGLPGLTGPPAQIGQWSSVQTWPAQGTHAAVLHTGKVLWWRDGVGTAAYVYDPVAGTQTPAPVPTNSGDWMCAGLTTLSDGRVFAMGGGGNLAFGQKPAMTFDPVSATWTRVADMQIARWYPTAKLLPDGRVLTLTGIITPGTIAGVPEIYNPNTNVWTLLHAADFTLPIYAFAFQLPAGGILYAGNSGDSSSYEHPAWTFDTSTQQWTFVASQNAFANQGSAAMYRPGKVLKVGGEDPAVNAAEVIDMNAPQPAWMIVSPMNYPRRRGDLVLLPDGTSLALGGTTSTQNEPACAVHAPEVYDPDTDTWTQWASMARPRMYHSTTLLLPDGRVLAAGGENVELQGGERNAEIFSPPYLFLGSRPGVTGGPSSAVYGETIVLTTPDAASIASVALMRPNAVTHNFDQNQMYVPLAFSDHPGSLSVTLPPDANWAPPGYYMIFLVNQQGAPSVAHWIRVDHAPCPGQDADSDGVLDCDDNCPAIANGPGQAGIAGVGNQTDTDADGSGDACDGDNDNDSLSDAVETDTGTYVSPTNTGTDSFVFDTDGDGLSDGEEVLTHGTDPVLADSDADGLVDGAEIETHGTDPLDGDSDDDGLLDGQEVVTYHTNPLDDDSDDDTLLDGEEVMTYHTNPLNQDTDGDTYDDAFEIQEGSDPNNRAIIPSIPVLPPWGSVALAALLVATIAGLRRRGRSFPLRA